MVVTGNLRKMKTVAAASSDHAISYHMEYTDILEKKPLLTPIPE